MNFINLHIYKQNLLISIKIIWFSISSLKKKKNLYFDIFFLLNREKNHLCWKMPPKNFIFHTQKASRKLLILGKRRVKTMDVLLNALSISAKKELHSLCCMMGKTMSLRCHFLAANGWRLIDWIQNKIKLST